MRRNGHNASIACLAEDAMAVRLAAYDKAYGAKEARAFLSVQEKPEFPGAGGPQCLDDLAKWAASCVARAEA